LIPDGVVEYALAEHLPVGFVLPLAQGEEACLEGGCPAGDEEQQEELTQWDLLSPETGLLARG